SHELSLEVVPALAVTSTALYIGSFSIGMGAVHWVVMSKGTLLMIVPHFQLSHASTPAHQVFSPLSRPVMQSWKCAEGAVLVRRRLANARKDQARNGNCRASSEITWNIVGVALYPCAVNK
ncbi:hypothetical protein IFM89_003255, partial [Coptis chinensis]